MVIAAAAGERSQGEQRREMAARLVPLVLLGAASCAAVAWMLSSDYTSGRWLLPFLIGGAVVGALAVSSASGPVGRIIGAVVMVAACLVGAWLTWTPEPTMFATLRGQGPAANASAEATLASIQPGTCEPAGNVDLGMLDGLGPWSEVCTFGFVDHSFRGVSYTRPDGSDLPSLTYAVDGGIASGCVRQIGADWWAVVEPSSDAKPCPRQYSYGGGG
jgi:hypothetical protein